jgi:hypothetical protein
MFNIKIVSTLILECACRFYASLSKPSFKEAMNMAYSQYITSNIHIVVMEQFSLSLKYSISQVTEFILGHHI